jgi:DNA (cytosine-5)-methyltransferase 1
MRSDRLTIGQAARFLGYSSQTLRRWDREEILVPDIRDIRTGFRYYSTRSLENFRNNRYVFSHPEVVEPLELPCFRFIDLFAGIGGIRMAFQEHGGECVFSSEIDRHSQKTYEYIFGEKPYGDINTIPVDQIPAHDLLLAGFPCQPFSLAGVSKYGSLGWEHGFRHKTKGTLFFRIAEILDCHRPRAFFLENVKNLRSHDQGKTWDVIYRTLHDELGYEVYSHIFDARSLVPQHRERIFIVGFKRQGIPFEWPEIPNFQPKVRDILDREVPEKYTLSDNLWQYLQDYAEKHRMKGNGFGYGLVDFEGITRTLSARYHKDGSEILIPQKDRNPRRLTPAECSRLMGFSQYDLRYEKPVVSDTQAYRQFGNAVVVPLVERVAEQILQTLTRHDPEFSEKTCISA